MDFLLITLLILIPLFALFAAGRFAQPSAERAPMRELTPRTIASTVIRGNDALAPTTPYSEFARR